MRAPFRLVNCSLCTYQSMSFQEFISSSFPWSSEIARKTRSDILQPFSNTWVASNICRTKHPTGGFWAAVVLIVISMLRQILSRVIPSAAASSVSYNSGCSSHRSGSWSKNSEPCHHNGQLISFSGRTPRIGRSARLRWVGTCNHCLYELRSSIFCNWLATKGLIVWVDYIHQRTVMESLKYKTLLRSQPEVLHSKNAISVPITAAPNSSLGTVSLPFKLASLFLAQSNLGLSPESFIT